MNAPVIWIGIPLSVGAFTFLLYSERTASRIGGFVCLLLAILALVVPIDEALIIGPVSIKIESAALLLGRSLVIPASAGPLLALIFGFCALWFFSAQALGVAIRLVPLGLVILALLIASLAVKPFLYAALLIELAVLAAVPLLVTSEQPPGRAVIKFLVYQTLGMPCILLAGWLLAGVETSPGDLALTIQATVMLSLGFAFLLAIFPLNDWIPGLMAGGQPYLTGFLLFLLPSIAIIFGLSFLDNYAWLRSTPQIATGLRVLGLVMLVTSGVAAAVERNLARVMGHAVIGETGLIFLAVSLAVVGRGDTIFPFFVPRGIGLLLWAMALTVARERHPGLELESLRPMSRTHPWAGAGLVLASLSAAGFPLLAGFPPRIDVWDGLAQVSTGSAIWFLLGLSGFMVAAIRQLTLLVGAPTDMPMVAEETPFQRALLAAAMAALVVLGLFPRALDFLVARLPFAFEHLAR